MCINNISSRDLSICIKSAEIFEVASNIAELIPNDSDDAVVDSVINYIVKDAEIIMVLTARGSKCKYYHTKMECATLCRKSAIRLFHKKEFLEKYNFEYPEYVEMLQNMLDEYRQLFVEWIRNMESLCFREDAWGLFKLPVVSANVLEKPINFSLN